jgi:hypothetical protein
MNLAVNFSSSLIFFNSLPPHEGARSFHLKLHSDQTDGELCKQV